MSEQCLEKVDSEKAELLVVDDSKVIRLAAKKMLMNDYVVHLAEDGSIGWKMLQQNSNISVVFTDLNMPNLDGMQLLGNIRNSSDDHVANLPVIIMTGQEDTESGKKTVFDAGATDFISKPFDSIDLLSRANSYTHLSRKVVELEKKTGYDKLTGLYNASLLEEQGQKAFSFSDRHKLFISTVYFEIVGFQGIVLKYGKGISQHIIAVIGKRIQEVMREEDIAARIAVAKYALVLPLTNKEKTEIAIQRVRESINKLVFDTGREKVRVDLVAGFSSPDLHVETDFIEMLEQADIALQQAMASTTQSVICYKSEESAAESALEISEHDIELAFEHILQSSFYQIPENHLAAVVERLAPFMQYIENQSTDMSQKFQIEKNAAV